jgi:hypothetical protein
LLYQSFSGRINDVFDARSRTGAVAGTVRQHLSDAGNTLGGNNLLTEGRFWSKVVVDIGTFTCLSVRLKYGSCVWG